MILFNTLKKAQHYIKYKNDVVKKAKDPYTDEYYTYYTISSNKVLYVTGWQCGCGCDNRWISNKVIGRVKSLN